MSEVIGDRFAVVRELGRGGVGRVLLAEDRHLGREVAIKTLLAEDARSRARFVEETQITGQLAHPNIVSVHALGVDAGTAYLVMRRVQGRELKDIVRALAAGERQALREYGLRHLLRLFLHVCEAVAYAHTRGVIHRDLKPANVMVTPDDDVLVLDWGLAKPLDAADASTAGDGSQDGRVRSKIRELESRDGSVSADLTLDGAVVGTPAYMPPEQADGGTRLDLRADVYSLGAILYELLALRPPFAGGAYQVLSQVLRGGPPPPSEVAPHPVPPPLQSIVLRAMARDPQERYANAAELAADVQRYLDGLKVHAHVETLREQLDRLLELHRRALRAAGAGFLLLVASLVAATVIVRGEQRQVEVALAAASEAADAASQQEAQRRAAAGELERAARAEEVLVGALRRVVEFEATSRTAVPLDRSEDRPGEAALGELHGAVRAALDADLAALVDLAEEGGGVRPFEERLDALRRRLDLAYAEILLARAPSRLAGAAPELDLGAEGPLLAARAAVRRYRPDEALRAVAGRSWPTPALAAAARALELRIRRGPLGARRAAWDQAVERSPAKSWLYLRRAECRAQQGDTDGALEDYDRAANLLQIDAWVHSSRILRTHSPGSQRDVNRLVSRFIALMAPENVEAQRVHLLSELWTFGDLDVFVAETRKLQQQDALTERFAERWIADAALVALELDVAERAAQRVLALEPEDLVGQGCLAEVRLLRGDLAGARALTEAALGRGPDDPRLNQVHGQVLVQAGERAQGIAHLRRGAQGAVTPDPWRILAEAYLESDQAEDWERGAEAALRGLSFDTLATFAYDRKGKKARPRPRDERLHRVLGHLRRKQGRLPAAALHYARAYAWSKDLPQRVWWGKPGSLEDALSLGEVHQAMGLLAEAAQCYAWAAEDPVVGARARRALERLQGR